VEQGWRLGEILQGAGARALEIPKDTWGGGAFASACPIRVTGLAQRTCAASAAERVLEPVFQRDSYGYRLDAKGP